MENIHTSSIYSTFSPEAPVSPLSFYKDGERSGGVRRVALAPTGKESAGWAVIGSASLWGFCRGYEQWDWMWAC